MSGIPSGPLDWEGAGARGRVYVLPEPTRFHLSARPEAGEVAELLWSTRCVAASPSRAVVLLSGPGPDEVGPAFELVHRVAEQVARELGGSGPEVGAIEVLVLRPLDAGTAFREAAADDGPGAVAVVDCEHAGGVDVQLRVDRNRGPIGPTGQE